MRDSSVGQRAPSCGEGRQGERERGSEGEGTVQEGRGITDEAKLILETIKSLKRECVFGRDSESL